MIRESCDRKEVLQWITVSDSVTNAVHDHETHVLFTSDSSWSVCSLNWAWAMSCRADWICCNSFSPFLTASSSFLAASRLSFSSCFKWTACSSGELSSLGRESMSKSISLAVLVINLANSCPYSSIWSLGGCCRLLFSNSLAKREGSANCWSIPMLLQKFSAWMLTESWSWVNRSAIFRLYSAVDVQSTRQQNNLRISRSGLWWSCFLLLRFSCSNSPTLMLACRHCNTFFVTVQVAHSLKQQFTKNDTF